MRHVAAQLHVERSTRLGSDALRRYTVVLDGRPVGRLRRGESMTVETNAGHHEVHLKIDWVRSPVLQVDLGEDERVSVRCWPNGNFFTWPYYTTFGIRRYLGIEADPDSSEAAKSS
jgi:hypothetical protein